MMRPVSMSLALIAISLAALSSAGCASDVEEPDVATAQQALIEPVCDPTCEPGYGPEPDGGYWEAPDDAPQSVNALAPPYGLVSLWVGGSFCWGVIQANSSIHYHADVIPNLGSPKAKIVIWRSSSASMSNATAVYSAKRTGPNAVDESFGGGFYQICAKYKVGQAVNGSSFDFMNVTTIANWN